MAWHGNPDAGKRGDRGGRWGSGKGIGDLGSPLGCLMSAWRSGLRWPAIVGGVVLAFVAWQGVGALLERAEPVRTVVHGAQIVVTDGTAANRSLQVDFTAPLPTGCVRVSQYALYDQREGGQVRYYPLGSALTGSGLARSGQQVPVRVVLALPDAIPVGEYQFVHRSAFSCSWAWGLFSRQITYESEPVGVAVR